MQIWRRSEAAGPCHFGPNVPRGRQLHGTGVLSLVATGAPGGARGRRARVAVTVSEEWGASEGVGGAEGTTHTYLAGEIP
jgi:hypothetical protein